MKPLHPAGTSSVVGDLKEAARSLDDAPSLARIQIICSESAVKVQAAGKLIEVLVAALDGLLPLSDNDAPVLRVYDDRFADARAALALARDESLPRAAAPSLPKWNAEERARRAEMLGLRMAGSLADILSTGEFNQGRPIFPGLDHAGREALALWDAHRAELDAQGVPL